MLVREDGRFVELVPCPDPDWYWLMYGEQFTDGKGNHWMRAEHSLSHASHADEPAGDTQRDA